MIRAFHGAHYPRLGCIHRGQMKDPSIELSFWFSLLNCLLVILITKVYSVRWDECKNQARVLRVLADQLLDKAYKVDSVLYLDLDTSSSPISAIRVSFFFLVCGGINGDRESSFWFFIGTPTKYWQTKKHNVLKKSLFTPIVGWWHAWNYLWILTGYELKSSILWDEPGKPNITHSFGLTPDS